MTTTNVNALRRQRGWTQEHLAMESGVTVRTIQRLESGEDASLETLRLVAMALEVNIQDLFENVESTNKEDAIMDLDTERLAQTRKRSAQAGLYRKIMLGGFIGIMIFSTSTFFTTVSISNKPLLNVLIMVWILLWALGLAAIKTIRSLWIEPSLDRKYPLTVGADLNRRRR